MTPDWFIPVLEHLGRGLAVTLWISFLSVIFATLLGVVIGCASAGPLLSLRIIARLYVEFFRGVPSLLILLFVFFALPQIGIRSDPITASVLGLSLWSAANIAETLRGAMSSISVQQTVAARALGMNALQAMVYIVLPQALRRFLPPYVGLLTVLVQASALTSVVGVTDLLGAARQMIERLAYSGGGSHALAIYGMVMAAFFVICYGLTMVSEYLERRIAYSSAADKTGTEQPVR